MAHASINTLSASLQTGEVSAEELARYYLDRMAQHNPALNCIITVCEEAALASARASDARRREGQPLSALDGIPLLHKDAFCTEGTRTTCGSRMLSDWVAPYDATVVSRLASAGLVMLGKTNMDEFAMGSSNEHSYFGACLNPWDTERVPGGSSGGSAAAIAADLAPLATATDTGGSIRQPAAFCGVTGLKPTYGRVSRYGMVAFASSLDQGGLMARRAADLAIPLKLISGLDARDSTSAENAVEDYAKDLDSGIMGLRVGLIKQHFDAGLDGEISDAVRAMAAQLEADGATIVELELARSALTIPTYYVLALAECSSNLSRYDGVRFGHRADSPQSLDDMYERSRAEGFGDEVKRRIMLGTYALSAGYYDAYYRKAQQLRRLVADDFAKAFKSVDVIAAPTTPTLPFKLGEHMADPVAMYLGDIYTCGVNLAGLPAINVPAGTSTSGLPIGAQLIGNHFSEATLLRTAHSFQRATEWHLATPSLGG